MAKQQKANPDRQKAKSLHESTVKRLEDEGEAVQLKRGINQQLCVTHSTQLPQ